SSSCISHDQLLLVALYFFSSFTPTPTTEIYTLSLHDALPISMIIPNQFQLASENVYAFISETFSSFFLLLVFGFGVFLLFLALRSEEHTSELQSRFDLVCRLLLEKKK